MEKIQASNQSARLDPAAETALLAILAAADNGDLEQLESLLAPGAGLHMNGLTLSPDDLKKRALAFKSAFPDIHRDLRPVASGGGTATAWGWISGTQRGEFLGKPATNKHTKVSALGFCKIDAAGKIAELAIEFNFAALMAQLESEA